MVQKYLVVLALIGLVDAISYMFVTPSLIFYVLQNGGNHDQYGLILSAFSFSSFCGKPIFGQWTDATKKYRTPYLASIFMAVLGGLVYFAASIFGSGYPKVAFSAVLVGRLLGGFGAANQALGFAYMATVTPPDKQTQTNTLLSMTRILGMASGPGFNALLAKVHLKVGGLTIDPLNSVGLVLAALNFISFAIVFMFLEEPPEKQNKGSNDGARRGSILEVLKAALQIKIIIPILVIFVVNSGFQLIETGFAPAASHGLGWGPVETSSVLGGSSVVIFAVMLLVLYLSSHDVEDHFLVGIGLSLYVTGGILMYELWVANGPIWHFVLPVVVTVSGFPFIGSSNRSLFTRSVENVPELQNSTAFMQALLSMFASVAGFVTPGFVASFVLRTPEEVDESSDGRELTMMAWYVPFLSAIALAGLIYVRLTWTEEEFDEEDDEEVQNEQSSLIRRVSHAAGVTKRRSSAMCPSNLPKEVLDEMLDPRVNPDRMKSCTLMGIPMLDTKGDIERRASLVQQYELVNEDWDKYAKEEDSD